VRKVVVVKPEVVVYFGLLLVKSEFWVAESEKRVAAIFLLPVWPLEHPGRSFFTLFWPVLSRYRTSTARNAFYKKTGCTNLNLWPESTIQKPEVLSKVHEMVRKVVKLTVIRKTSWSNMKWVCKTGSSCVLWPTFDVNTVKLGNGMR